VTLYKEKPAEMLVTVSFVRTWFCHSFVVSPEKFKDIILEPVPGE
jgi:hypothetical protein